MKPFIFNYLPHSTGGNKSLAKVYKKEGFKAVPHTETSNKAPCFDIHMTVNSPICKRIDNL